MTSSVNADLRQLDADLTDLTGRGSYGSPDQTRDADFTDLPIKNGTRISRISSPNGTRISRISPPNGMRISRIALRNGDADFTDFRIKRDADFGDALTRVVTRD